MAALCLTWPAALLPALSHLSKELLQQGGGPVVVEVPVFGRVADVGCVQQQRQGFGFVNAVKGKTWTLEADAFLKPFPGHMFIFSPYKKWKTKYTFLG